MGGNTRSVPRPLYWAFAGCPIPVLPDAVVDEIREVSFDSELSFFRSTKASTQILASAYKLSSKTSSSLSSRRQSGPSSFLQCSTVTRLAPFGSPAQDLSA